MAGMGCDDAYMKFVNKRAEAMRMKSLFAEEKVSEEAAAEADAAAREACFLSKPLCRNKREDLLRMLDDPTSDLTPADREAWQRECDVLAKRLTELDEAYPGELENKPPPKLTAKRTVL